MAEAAIRDLGNPLPVLRNKQVLPVHVRNPADHHLLTVAGSPSYSH